MSIGPFAAPGEVKRMLPSRGRFDKGFQQAIATLKGFESLGIAVVDLTPGPNQYQYAATSQENEDKHVFSLAKLAPFLASV